MKYLVRLNCNGQVMYFYTDGIAEAKHLYASIKAYTVNGHIALWNGDKCIEECTKVEGRVEQD